MSEAEEPSLVGTNSAPPSSGDTTAGQANTFSTDADEPIEDVEHLQLTLQEAFFLAYALDCLTVYDADTVRLLFFF